MRFLEMASPETFIDAPSSDAGGRMGVANSETGAAEMSSYRMRVEFLHEYAVSTYQPARSGEG